MMRVHVIRIADDLVVNTIIADELPSTDGEYRFVECDGRPAGPGCRILADGTLVVPEPELTTDTVESLAAQLADLQSRLAALQESAS